MKPFVIFPFVGVIGATIGFAVLAQSASDNSPVDGLSFLGEPVTAADIEAGQQIYAESCASCHGANLEGQPDWKRRLDNGRMPAPPHDATGHSWHHADAHLIRITRDGTAAVVGDGYESDMIGFGDVLSAEDILAVLGYIKSTWPPEIIDRHNEVNRSGGH